MSKKVIFIPSSSGSSGNAFYKNVGNLLEKSGFEVLFVNVETENKLKIESWLAEIKKLESEMDENTYLISHSNGTLAAARFLSETGIKIKSWQIVAGIFDPNNLQTENTESILQAQNFLENTEIDWNKINKNIEFINLHYSEDDTIVPFAEIWKYKQALEKASVQKYQNKGHFQDLEFTELAEFILEQEKNSWMEIENQKYKIKLLNKSELPLILPQVDDYQPDESGKSPLSKNDWINIKDENGNIIGRHEADVMPNWAGSSWYYLRYLDPKNSEVFASPEKLKYWLPVDHYFGGSEHTTLHLLYSRFWHKFLYDQGLVPTPEPYTKRTNGGMLLGTDGQKMSKSRGNVINPTEKLAEVGADALRLYIAFIGPYDATVVWQNGGIKACKKLIDTIFKLSHKVTKFETETVDVINNLNYKQRLEIQTALQKSAVEKSEVVVKAVITNSKGEIFVQKRTLDKQFLSNIWDLVGGNQQTTETIFETIKRKIHEEIGLKLKSVEELVEIYFWKNTDNHKKTILTFSVKIDENFETEKNIESVWINKNNLEILKENSLDTDGGYTFRVVSKILNRQKYLVFDFDGVLADNYEQTAKVVKIIEGFKTVEEAKAGMQRFYNRPQHDLEAVAKDPESLKISEIRSKDFATEILKIDFPLFDPFIREILNLKHTNLAVVSSGSNRYINPKIQN
jgi:predicted alpha/beta hydrolase family esterase/8-oxo-dGTP pyrophosphatase MutT (NUDIX family)